MAWIWDISLSRSKRFLLSQWLGRGWGAQHGRRESVSWTRILQNGPYGHLHAIMRACMRSDAGTGDCAPTLAWRAHVWSPASFMHKHSMNGALLGIIWYWNMIDWTHARHTHGARTCTWRTHGNLKSAIAESSWGQQPWAAAYMFLYAIGTYRASYIYMLQIGISR